MLLQQFALLLDNLFNQGDTLLHRQMATQAFVVDTTHGNGIDVLVLRGLAETVVPLLPDGLAVGLVVPLAVTFAVPLALGGVVQQQRLTVAGSDNDAK